MQAAPRPPRGHPCWVRMPRRAPRSPGGARRLHSSDQSGGPAATIGTAFANARKVARAGSSPPGSPIGRGAWLRSTTCGRSIGAGRFGCSPHGPKLATATAMTCDAERPPHGHPVESQGHVLLRGHAGAGGHLHDEGTIAQVAKALREGIWPAHAVSCSPPRPPAVHLAGSCQGTLRDRPMAQRSRACDTPHPGMRLPTLGVSAQNVRRAAVGAVTRPQPPSCLVHAGEVTERVVTSPEQMR
jgi:hypothetical protein